MANVTVSQWAAQSQARLEAVFREAAQEIVKEVQTPRKKGGKMPVDTSFLRNSFAAEVNKIPSGDGDSAYKKGPISIVINRAVIGDRVVFGWAASYAIYMESKYSFLRSAAQNWQQIVDRSAQKVKTRVEG